MSCGEPYGWPPVGWADTGWPIQVPRPTPPYFIPVRDLRAAAVEQQKMRSASFQDLLDELMFRYLTEGGPHEEATVQEQLGPFVRKCDVHGCNEPAARDRRHHGEPLYHGRAQAAAGAQGVRDGQSRRQGHEARPTLNTVVTLDLADHRTVMRLRVCDGFRNVGINVDVPPEFIKDGVGDKAVESLVEAMNRALRQLFPPKEGT